MEVAVDLNDNYLEVKVTGDIDTDDTIDYFKPLLTVCEQCKIYRVLIDYSEVKDDMIPIDKFKYALEVKSQYDRYLESGGKPLRIAYLRGKSHENAQINPGFELVEKEGLPIIHTSDLNEALRWLEAEETA